MTKLLPLAFLTATLYSQSITGKSAVTVKPPAAEIRAEDQAGDPPEFKRKYSAKLSSKPGLTMTLECENDRILKERHCVATIRQPDEKSVSFTVGGAYAAYDSIADKIIDPVIVPEVKRLAAEMHLQDVKYMLSEPSEFKTSDGNRWHKEK
jgi:hypothetical protein